MKDSATQLAVIGAGPGGYAAAFLAADLGLSVTLIDKESSPGGVCLYRGCIPSKSLLHVAKVIVESREAINLGIEFGEPRINIERLRSWKAGVVQKLTGGLGNLTKQRKINYIKGEASFTNRDTLKIRTVNGGVQSLKFGSAVIATGSSPVTVPGLSIASARIMDSTGALELKDIPRSLLVIGGGYIGLELGTVYAALGTQVSVVEMTTGLLPGADRDLVDILFKRLKKIFHCIMLDTKVVSMKEAKDGIQVALQGPDVTEPEQVFEKVLIAVGRRPNTQNLGLENTRIEVDQRGFIVVDVQRRTAEDGIFAIGDVAGEPMLAHKATHEGRTAAEVIAGKRVTFEPQAIPAVVFTDPEIAWCGLTETEATAKNIPVKVTRFPWAASGRATTLGISEGITKLIINPETDQVLGVGIVGSGAGELIAEGVLAIEMAALAGDIGLTIHAHPTISETIMESADLFYGHSLHVYTGLKV